MLVVPLGSTEQHGPHLPLDTDTTIAVTVAERAAAAVPDAIVAPALPVGASGEHAGFAGTLSTGREVLTAAIVEIVRTAGSEFDRVVLVNGHGGNAEAVQAAAATCEAEGRPVRIWYPTHPGGDAHAGRTETSVMLAIDPDRVRLDRAEIGATAPLGDLIDELRVGGVRAVARNGVLGDPTGANAAEGEQLLAGWVGQLVALLET